MSDLRKAAQQALEALEMSKRFVYADNRPQCDDAIDSLRAALAQEQAEPKPMHPELRKMWEEHFDRCFRAMPLLAQEQAEPLTDEEIETVWRQKPRWHAPPIGTTDIEFARAIEKKVRGEE